MAIRLPRRFTRLYFGNFLAGLLIHISLPFVDVDGKEKLRLRVFPWKRLRLDKDANIKKSEYDDEGLLNFTVLKDDFMIVNDSPPDRAAVVMTDFRGNETYMTRKFKDLRDVINKKNWEIDKLRGFNAQLCEEIERLNGMLLRFAHSTAEIYDVLTEQAEKEGEVMPGQQTSE